MSFVTRLTASRTEASVSVSSSSSTGFTLERGEKIYRSKMDRGDDLHGIGC